mmetsp:Transcript_79640/g.234234  ORF Transcript_79640/g.234234 Transcript_79640/m.234234 type:complete len:318 (-) Transcript_79640:52-1005(-)
MAFRRAHLFLSIALIHAAQAAEVSDEQSLVQKGINFHALAAAPDIFASPHQLLNISLRLPQSLNFLRAALPPKLQSALELFESAMPDHTTLVVVAAVLTWTNETYVAKVNAGIAKLASSLDKFVQDLEKAGYDLSTHSESANVSYSLFVLEQNCYSLVEAIAAAGADLIMIAKDIVDAQPTEFMQKECAGLTKASENVTRDLIFTSIENTLKPEVKDFFSKKEQRCQGFAGITSYLGIATKEVCERGQQYEADKDPYYTDVAPAIRPFAPGVVTELSKTYNLTMETFMSFSRNLALGLHIEETAMKEVLSKNLGCPA